MESIKQDHTFSENKNKNKKQPTTECSSSILESRQYYSYMQKTCVRARVRSGPGQTEGQGRGRTVPVTVRRRRKAGGFSSYDAVINVSCIDCVGQ